MTRIVDKFSGGATIYDNGVSLLSDRGGIGIYDKWTNAGVHIDVRADRARWSDNK